METDDVRNDDGKKFLFSLFCVCFYYFFEITWAKLSLSFPVFFVQTQRYCKRTAACTVKKNYENILNEASFYVNLFSSMKKISHFLIMLIHSQLSLTPASIFARALNCRKTFHWRRDEDDASSSTAALSSLNVVFCLSVSSDCK